MRLTSCCLLMLVALSPATPLAAQSIPAPTPAPAPQTPAAPATVAPSEPWQPPPSLIDSQAGAPVPELPLPGSTDPATDAATNVIVQEPSPWYSPILWLGPAPWDSGIELGLNGSSGTSDSFSIRTGAYVKRESRFSKLDLSAVYNLTMNAGKSTQDNGQFDVRHDWLIDESSPWTLFALTDLFYDKFEAFDAQANLNTGIGYRFVHTPELDLMTRFGGGASREIGGPDDRWVPESLLGIEYCQKFSQTQKFYGKLDYYPEWDQVGECRLVADTGWEIELLQPSNLSLKISATDRYDSTPEGVNPHLVNYSVLLLLKL